MTIPGSYQPNPDQPGSGGHLYHKHDGARSGRTFYRQGSTFTPPPTPVASPDAGQFLDEVDGPFIDGQEPQIGTLKVLSRSLSRAEYHEDLKKDLRPWATGNLLLTCGLILFCSSFLFGYNISVLGQPVQLIRDFYNKTYTERNGYVSPSMVTFLWSLTTALYLPGGMIGAYSAGFLADRFGRKRSLLGSLFFALAGAIVSVFCTVAHAPELLMLGRFLVGIHCGIGNQLAPIFLAEIAPVKQRGSLGAGHQVFIALGILSASILGLRSLLGTAQGWPCLLLVNAAPAILALALLPLVPDSPRFLMLNKGDTEAATAALKFYRHSDDVANDLEEMETEQHETQKGEVYTICKLLRARELRTPLLVAIALMVIQQLSGINAFYFYAVGVFVNAGIPQAMVEYVVVTINVITFLMTFVTVVVVDRVGRRPLLLITMIIMALILVLFTLLLHFQPVVSWFSRLSVPCVLIYVTCFAIGLGPLPTIIGTELFRQGPRPKVLSLAGLAGWMSNTLVALTFEILRESLYEFTFLVFLGLMVLFILFVYFKVPETKNKTFEEIAHQFSPGDMIMVDEVIQDAGPEWERKPVTDSMQMTKM